MSVMDMSKYQKKFKKGDVLMREGEDDSRIFLLKKGILDVFILGRKVNSIDAALSQDFVGEVGAVLGTPRTATIVAATDCVTLCLPRIELEDVITSSSSLGVKLIRSLCHKLASSASAVAEFQVKHSSLLHSGNTELSLRNYMKGLLYLMEMSEKDVSSENGKKLLDYFLQTNPWGIQHGDSNQILNAGYGGEHVGENKNR
jgi:CRP-like cAMP-binding protein